MDATGADLILVGGDFAAGPMPAETTALLRGLGGSVRFIRGNAERELAERRPAPRVGGPPPGLLEWIRSRLSEEEIAWAAGLPLREILDVDVLGTVLFCHATPRSDEEIVTSITPEPRLREMLAGVVERLVVCGHTHVQYDRRADGTRLVNAGSVGMPYEAQPGAYWVLLGPDVELRRTEYDAESAAARIRATGYPEEIATVSPQEATEYFESIARG